MSTKTKHTAGEWHITGLEIRAQNCMILANVYEHNPMNQSRAEAEANAKLIAAAPELLQALKNLLKSYRADFKNIMDEELGETEPVIQALAAIDKATE